MKRTYFKSHDAGFALLEVLVTLLILAGGLLALSKFQGTLMQNSSVARQRTEAVMLGQQKIEDLRSFEVMSTATGKLAYADIATGSDSISATTATFTRSWTVTANTNPTYKNITMAVSWSDSRGAAQSVTLGSMISSTDPALSGSLITITSGGTDTPYNRNTSIPTGATDNGNGTSTYNPPGSTGVNLVYDNTSGQISSITSGGSTQGVTAQSITGFASRGSGGDAPHVALSAINFTATSTSGNSYGCWDDSASPTYSGYATYTCAVSYGWSGTITLSGMTLGTTSSTDKVCRYYSTSPYSNVTANFSNQNYNVIQGNRSCPSGATQHQP